MSRRPRALLRVIVLAGLAAFLLQACAAGGGPPSSSAQSPEERLANRAKAYWEVRVKGDLVAQYSFQEPYYRENVTLTSFLKGRGATHVLGYEIKETSVQGEEGRVKLQVKYRPAHRLTQRVEPQTIDFDQGWIMVDREWFVKYK
jgi:hypothetical protein